MGITIKTRNGQGREDFHTVDKDPDKCPICHNGIKPIDQHWNSFVSQTGLLERALICPLGHCQHVFIAQYSKHPASGLHFLRQCVPMELQSYRHPDELQKISPDFCSIYDEAHKAEQHGLTLVSGPGYRKALEFLVKDYVTSPQATDEEKAEIAEIPLMACIKKYVTDTRMRTTAERATWLGNDETHYVRKWEDKDLQDMKRFIQLTCFWIQSEHLTSAAVIEMPQGKK